MINRSTPDRAVLIVALCAVKPPRYVTSHLGHACLGGAVVRSRTSNSEVAGSIPTRTA